MLKKLVFSVLVLFFCIKIYSQIPIGQYIDSRGIPIDGFLDVPEYIIDSEINTEIISNQFEKGYYYNEAGEKISGYLKLKKSAFLFKSSEDALEKKLFTPNDVKSLVLGQDSFFVANINDDLVYAKAYASIDQYDYALFYKTLRYNKVFLAKSKGSDKWIVLNDLSYTSFENFVTSHFGHIPLIKSHEWAIDDIPTLIKIANYYHLYRTNGHAYYDRLWKPTDSLNASYRGKIISFDSLMTITFFKGNTKINVSQYQSLGPEKREGYSRWYYESGTLRKETFYEKNIAQEISTFFPNGQLHYRYKLKYFYPIDLSLKSSKNERKAFLNEAQFLDVYTADGNALLDSSGYGNEVLADEVNKRVIHRTFYDHKLIESSFQMDGSQVYQLVGLQYNLNIIDNKWDKFIKSYNLNAFDLVASGASGTTFLALNIGKNRACMSYKALFTHDDTFYDCIQGFFKKRILLPLKKPILFKPFKLDKERMNYELVIPFSLDIKRFYLEPDNSFPYSNDLFLHQPPFELPPMPRGF